MLGRNTGSEVFDIKLDEFDAASSRGAPRESLSFPDAAYFNAFSIKFGKNLMDGFAIRIDNTAWN